MGGCFSFNRSNEDEMPKGKQFDYLRPEGTITYTVDRMYDVSEVEINFDSWYRASGASVCLSPKSTKIKIFEFTKNARALTNFFYFFI